MNDLTTYLDFPVTDQVLASIQPSSLDAVDPWEVMTDKGQRLLAYGPWRVVSVTRNQITQITTYRIMRWRVRRLSARPGRYMVGKVWDVASMGAIPLPTDRPILFRDVGTGISAKFSPNLIRSQT